MNNIEINNNSKRQQGLTSRAARGLQDQVPAVNAGIFLAFLLETCNTEKIFPFFLFLNSIYYGITETGVHISRKTLSSYFYLENGPCIKQNNKEDKIIRKKYVFNNMNRVIGLYNRVNGLLSYLVG